MRGFPLSRLTEAFTGHRCVTAWLGHGDVLFLGFGDCPLPERDANGRRTLPPYELQTNFADWRIDGPFAANTQDSDRLQLTAAAESLIGEQALAFELVERTRVRLKLSGQKSLTVKAWSPDEGLAEAWSLSSPDGLILAVATDGRFGLFGPDEPLVGWFKRDSNG